MLEFTVPVLIGASLIGVITGLLVRESPTAFLFSGYAAVTVFVVIMLILEIASGSVPDAIAWLWIAVFLGVWSILVFVVASGVGFATSSLIWRRSQRR